MTSRVTVGIPTLNSERFLEQQLSAWSEQTNRDFKIVLVDGGSTDGTLSIAERWCRKDARIQIASQQVVGLYRAFNAILDGCETEFVTIQPADDLVSETLLQSSIDGLDAFANAVAAVAPLRVIDERSMALDGPFAAAASWIEPLSADSSLMEGKYLKTSSEAQLHPWPLDGCLGLSGTNPYVSQNQIVYRTGMLGNHRFDATYGTTADILFNLQTGLTHDVVHVKGCWAGWRLHQDQASQRSDSRECKYDDLRTMLADAIDAYRDAVPDRGQRRAIQRVADVMAGVMHLRHIAPSKTRVQRVASVIKASIANPQAAWLYLRDRNTADPRWRASELWLRDQAFAITADRMARGIERSPEGRDHLREAKRQPSAQGGT